MPGERIQYTIGIDADISAAKASMDSLQKTFSNFGVSSNFGEKINQEFAKFGKAYETYMSKINNGIKTKGDFNTVTKSLNEMKSAMAGVAKEAVKIGNADPFKAFKNDKIMSGLLSQIDDVQKRINNFKFDTSKFKGIFDQIGANISKSNTNIPNLMDQIMKSNQAGNYEGTISGLNKLQSAVALSKQRMEELSQQYKKGSAESDAYKTKAEQLGQALEKIKNVNPSNLTGLQTQLENLLGQADSRAKALTTSWQDFTSKVQQSQGVMAKTADSLQRIHKEEFGMQRQIEMVDRQIQSYFGLTQILRKVMNIARQAMNTVKELDKAMTETAVVTNFDVGDMWEKLPQYTAMANQLGATINDVYKATTLYYQQGLNMNQAMGIAEETLKMARIGGIDAAEATNMMTAALRGFNMQINEMSAQKVNDVYSKIAAMSASNTKELGEAMERTASIANSAGMEFGNTTAFLAQMIETTREAPENLGTAMKTIVARFQEMKKSPTELIDVEGEMVDVNRVDKALKSVGIALTDTEGNFRNLDQVFLEISERWNQLSMGQQRYIATMAAGSRQQSRFIALVGNHERLMELVDGANNSAGASQEQFNKTLDSFATKANKLKNAWDAFTMGLLNDKLLKGTVDNLTNFMTIVNKIIDVLSSATGPFKGFTKSLLTLAGVMTLLSTARIGLSAGIGGAFSWFAGKTTMAQLFGNAKDAVAQGTLAGTSYVKAAATAVNKEGKTLNQAVQKQWNQKGLDTLSNKNNYRTWKTEDGKNTTVMDQIKALKAGELQATKANLDSIRGGITQSLFSNSNFVNGFTNEGGVSAAVRDGSQLIDNYVKALTQQIKVGTGKGAKEAQAAVKQARGAIGKAAFQGALKNGSTKEEASKAAAQAVKDAEQNTAMIPTTKVDAFTKSVGNANSGLMQLGMLLQNTPLAPFGKLLTMVSLAASAFTGIISGLVGELALLTVGGTANAAALSMEAAGFAANTKWAELDAIAKWKVIVANKGVAGTLGLVVAHLGPILAIGAALFLLYKAFTYNAKQLQTLHDRAAAASDAYKAVKQEVSELKDNLKQLEEYDEAFKTLVSGTAEFNSKLVESNELITQLIKKYPMLETEGYVTTDKNGRMQISQAGRDAIQQLATERQAKAQAIDIFANADYKKEQARQDTLKSKEYEEAYQNENRGVAGRYGYLYRKRNQEKIKTEGLDTTEDVITKAEEKALAQVKQAQSAAVTAMITSQKDLIDRNAVSRVMSEGYDQLLDTIKADAEGKDRAKTYAKAYGYEYISGNKFKDQSGNEIEVKKDIWNDETTNKRIKANEQIISSAETVDRTLDSLNGKVAGAFDNIKIESDTLISDILSSNIETNRDDLKAIIEEGNLKELTKNLTDEQVEALKQAGIDDLEATLKERGEAILEAQKQQDESLATMLAKARGLNPDDFVNNTERYANQISAIGMQLDALSAKERNLLATVGQGIEDSLGQRNMGKFVSTFIDGTQTVRNRLSSITKDVDWTSSISALGAITKMTRSSVPEIKKLGQEMRTSAEGSHLLTDSMQELFAAEDFTKVTENMDNFVNSSGRLDATGIQKMAQESGTLSKLLKTDAISAGGLAAALNATSISGVADVTSLNDSVLQLLSSFTQLETVMAEAHDIVSNFDPGIDTGEGVDFIKDAYEKASEYIKNGEWGNSQLESYMRLVAGDEAWTKALQDNNGNLEKTVKQLQPVLKKFENGYAQSWVNLAKGVDAYGNSIKDVKFKSKELQKLKLTKVNGGLELNVKESGATTEQVTKWIEKSYKVSSEVAKLMLADFKNMSPNLVPELEANDFYAGIKNGDFYNTNTIKTAGGNEIVALSKSTLDVLSAATGKPIAEIETAIKNSEQARNKDIQILQNTYAKGEKKGELIDNYQLLNKRLSNLSEGQKQNKDRTDTLSWLKQFTSNNTIDVTKALSYGERVGLDTSQTQGMLYEAFQALTKEGKEFEYNGQVINPSEVTSLGDFIDKLTKIDENENWNEVGAAIAEGYVNYIKGKEEQEQQEEEKEEKWESNSQSKAETYKLQPSSTKVLESRPELAAAATNEEIGDVGARAATFAKINKELKLTKTELADVNAGFIQLNMADLSTLSEDQLQQVFDMLGMTKKEAKSAKHDIDNFSALTPDQKEISIRTDISGEEKVSAMLQPILDEFGDGDTTKKTLIIEAAARMAEGKNDEAEELLKQAGIEGEELETVTKQIDFTVNAGLANPKEVQDSLNKEVDKACNLGSGVSGTKKAKIKKKVQIQYEEGGKKPKTRSTITTGIKVGKDEASAKMKELEKGGSTSFKIEANDKEALKTVNAIHKKAKESETFNVSANFIGDWKKNVVITVKKRKGSQEEEGEATGVRQMGSIPSLPTFESLASGKHTKQLGTGQIGPKGNGGLTLTGELGYEIAWLPREGRSMILGANGPEMLNLPGDAVVWNHEQSKKIIKNNAIPTGSTAIGAGSAAFYPTGGGGGAAVTTRGATTKSENKSNSKKSKNNKYQEKILKQTWKLLSTAGKISNWWEDISRQVEGIQRIADRNQKDFKKLIDTAGTTLSDVQKNSETYSKSLQKSIQLNEEIVKHYKDKLDALTSGKGQSAKSRKGAVSGINKAANEVTKAEAKVELAKQTKSKKDDKKAKKNLRNAKKRLKNAKKKDKSAAVDTVTYDDEIQVITKKKTRKGKGKWKNKTVKKKKKVKSTRAVDWSKIIEYDAETDTWVLNDKEINTQAGGNKKAAKAIKEKGNKKINEMIQRHNSAQDKIDSARESLNQLAEDVYQMFSRWEKSLTHVYLISQKLESLQKKADIYDTQEEYLSTKALAGYNPFSQESLDKLNTILTNRQNGLVEQAKAQKDLVDATYKQYEEAFQLNTYLTNGNIGSETGGESQSGVNEQEAARIAFTLLKKAGAEDIDTYDSVKVQQAYDEYTKGRYTNKTDEEVKKILDRIAEYQGSYYDALKESYTSVTEIYKTLNEYEEYINDFEESLLKGLEEEINKEIDKQEKLNSALTNAFKDLLDEVKHRLDQRRQTEDNAKTESDIAKKQQRLATLQADTSGGKASEIKQLQQEIAEAQQSYGRTLEDQLLEKLQQQGDEAEKQRERQIKLLEIHRDLAEALGTNLEEVKEWLQNPEANKEQIKSAWLANQNYDEALPDQQKTLENQFEEAWTKYLAYGARAQDLREFLDEVNFDNTPQEQAAQSLQKIETNLGGLKQTIEGEVKKRQAAAGEKSHNYINEVEEPTIDYGKISNFKENGVELEEARTKAENLGIDNSYASMREGGYTAEDFKKAGVSVSDALGAGFDYTQLKEGGYTAEDFKNSNLGAVEAAKAGFGYGDLIKGGYTYQDILNQQSEFEALAQANGGLKSDFIAQALAEQESEEIRKKEREQQKQIALRDVKYIAKQIDPNNPTGKKAKEMLFAWATNNNSFLKEFAGMAIPMKTGSGHINSNGQLYFNDKKGNIKRFNFTNGKFSNVKYNQKDWEKHAGYNQVSDTPYIMAEFQQALKKRNAKKYTKFTNKAPILEMVPIANAIAAYASGGMNYTTGPAWLDGTRAKPEAVLNATDTKNFIALKDILSDVMGHITDNNTTTYGDSTYEININVDHLNNDYDVDKVAKRVEKIITEDASYRNVTMVRKFR